VLARGRGGGAHDWLVVTLLTTPPALSLLEVEALLVSDPEEELEVVEVVVVDGAVVVVVDGVDATEVADDRLASAGSWPETSTSVMNSQDATNSASAPAMMRRRILRARAIRALRMAWPRARAAWLMSAMIDYLGVVGVGRSVGSASTGGVSTA
jgi:hypothetical protein